ncbi:hypothetical protein BIV25_21540 [Streptomyces sp. MUSC 14]|uniref:hypothetical protein n=1 Tax=Streptomyces sp. MUSC 14 TaxID=1354889 RepID=UPI0008F56665|nr:hypothetical protein [Streptomyces sp. MUSC 14]OIJ94667.1 hypothetical protein BIV25_21540 [Streptomyces sp. MUSC 14]
MRITAASAVTRGARLVVAVAQCRLVGELPDGRVTGRGQREDGFVQGRLRLRPVRSTAGGVRHQGSAARIAPGGGHVLEGPPQWSELPQLLYDPIGLCHARAGERKSETDGAENSDGSGKRHRDFVDEVEV